MKIILKEDQVMNLRLKRRGIEIKKIGDIIEHQTEIQDPCDFDDAEEYVDFCIGQGLGFYYCDENYCDEDDEDYKEPSEEMLEVRDEVEEYLYNKFYDYLVDIYNDLKTDCE
jgi:broad-specificity NMP kinase